MRKGLKAKVMKNEFNAKNAKFGGMKIIVPVRENSNLYMTCVEMLIKKKF